MDKKGLRPMSQVRAELLKIRRWKMLADVVDRGTMVSVLIGLVTLAVMRFLADGILGVFEALAATLKRML